MPVDINLAGGASSSHVHGADVASQTASYTLAAADEGKIVEVNSATSVTVTVPPNSSVAFSDGTIIGIRQVGAGGVTIAAGAGVTLRNATTGLSEQWTEVSLHRRAADDWVILTTPETPSVPTAGPDYVTGRYYDARLTCAATATQGAAANILRLMPFKCQSDRTFDRIGIQVTTAGDALTKARLGVYSLTNGVPSALKAQSAELDISATGFKEDAAFSVTLTAGWYALALLHNSSTTTPAFAAVNRADGSAPHLGRATGGASSNAVHNLWYASVTYGSLPDPCPAVSYIDSLNPYLVELRAA